MPKQKKKPKPPSWLVPAGIAVVALALIGIVVAQGVQGTEASQESPGTPDDQQQGELSEAERRDSDDLQAAGPVDAEVGLIVFSDYQCQYCASWTEDTLPEMMKYVDSGDMRIEWRDVNVFGDASELASRAAYAAALQGRYWEYHDALFPDGEHLPESQLTEDALTDLAADLGLDREQFAADMDADGTHQEIQRNSQEGMNLGVTSTPVFILAGEPLVGAQPTDVFVDAVDDALA